MEVNASNTQGNNNNLANSPMQASAAYTATQVRSTFTKGKFTQELKGNALKNLNPTQLASVTGRPSGSSNTNQPATNQPQGSTRIPNLATDNNGSAINLENQLNPNLWNSEPNNIPVAAPNSSTSVGAPPIQPATPAEAPTSNGDIDVFAGLAGTSGFTPPQNAATAVKVFGDTGTTTATPSATSQALQNGQTVVFTDSGTRITTEAQSMAAKDA
jgi:hypothetical protein